MKTYEAKNGASVIMDDTNPVTGFTRVVIRKPNGELHDKVMCDTKTGAREYFKCFKAIARNL